ncbi:10268_t:CDS:2, partial [Dentiscutata heterogama]
MEPFSCRSCDSIAMYLYLINLGPNAGFEPISSKRVIFAGESTSVLRDTRLPLPAGAIAL